MAEMLPIDYLRYAERNFQELMESDARQRAVDGSFVIDTADRIALAICLAELKRKIYSDEGLSQ